MSANTRSWVQGLLTLGHEVEVITFHPGEIVGAKVHAIAPNGPLGKSTYLLAIPRIRRQLRRMKPDVVIGYYLSSYGLVASLAWGHPLILAPAGSDLLLVGRHNLLAQVRLRWLVHRADLFLSWAAHMAERLEELGASRNEILVVPRGIDTTVFAQRGESVARGRCFSVVSTRNFRAIYDLETSIEAIAQLASRAVDVEYRLLGRGPLRESLEALAKRRGVRDRVTFPGHCPPPVIAGHLRGSDVYLATTRSDGASSSLFEAMACGTFPVVSDIPANREWIRHGVNGMLVPPGQAGSFAGAIEEALTSERLRSEAAVMNARIVAERLDRQQNMRTIAERISALVESVTVTGGGER